MEDNMREIFLGTSLLTYIACLLVLMSGCAGVSPATDQGNTFNAQSPSVSTESQSLLSTETVETATLGPNSVRYSALSLEAKRIFNEARANGSVTVREGVPNDLSSHDYVLYNGSQYRVETQATDNIPRYDYTVQAVDNSSVSNDTQVVPFSDLTSLNQERFHELRNGTGTTEDPIPNDLTEPLIRHNGTIYDVEVTAVADIRIWIVEVSRAEN